MTLSFCGNCMKQVLIVDTVKVHTCPDCGQPILPCATCTISEKDIPEWDGCKKSCPFNSEFTRAMVKWRKENNK